MDQFLSKYQYGFPKGFNAQHCLLAMLEKWKKAVDTKKVFGALLTDLSKAFDCLPLDLIIAKLNAYGFSLPALNLIQNYLANRKQRTKINDYVTIASYADNNILYDSCDTIEEVISSLQSSSKNLFNGYKIIR